MNRLLRNGARSVLVTTIALLLAVAATAQESAKTDTDNEITILVTVMPHNDRTKSIAENLVPADFAVKEQKITQKIISVRRAGEAPVSLAVLIQDNLVGRVSNELGEIKEFIRALPDGSNVMTAYLTMGSLGVRQNFTDDKEKAADSFRILLSSDVSTPFSPYIQVVDGLKMFEGQPADHRKMLLLISDGLDHTFGLRLSSPSYSIYLDRAVREAQKQGVAVFTMFAPSVGLTRGNRHALNYGQGSLLRFADETGGEAFFTGSDFVTFNPYFDEYNALMKNQWLLTYQSKNTEKGFRKIDVTTDFDIHLHHPAGYIADKK